MMRPRSLRSTTEGTQAAGEVSASARSGCQFAGAVGAVRSRQGLVECDKARAHLAVRAVPSVSARRCCIAERWALERHVAHGAVFSGPLPPLLRRPSPAAASR
ncbi:unnamed protein product, partial [Prorocentrum cordatum]